MYLELLDEVRCFQRLLWDVDRTAAAVFAMYSPGLCPVPPPHPPPLLNNRLGVLSERHERFLTDDCCDFPQSIQINYFYRTCYINDNSVTAVDLPVQNTFATWKLIFLCWTQQDTPDCFQIFSTSP
jgi:hypothetical protein